MGTEAGVGGHPCPEPHTLDGIVGGKGLDAAEIEPIGFGITQRDLVVQHQLYRPIEKGSESTLFLWRTTQWRYGSLSCFRWYQLDEQCAWILLIRPEIGNGVPISYSHQSAVSEGIGQLKRKFTHIVSHSTYLCIVHKYRGIRNRCPVQGVDHPSTVEGLLSIQQSLQQKGQCNNDRFNHSFTIYGSG